MQMRTAASADESHTGVHGGRLTIAAFQLIVGQTDVLEKHPQRPTISDSIVHVDHQDVLLLLGQGNQGDMDHRAGGEVKCSGNGLS